MIIRAPRPTSYFTQLRNDVLRDARLSYKARGLLAFILSHPDGWRFNAAYLAKASPDGRHAISTGLTELEKAGYLHRRRYRNTDGTYGTRLIAFDVPRGHPDFQGPPEDVDKNGDKSPATTDYPTRITTPSIEHSPMNNDQRGITQHQERAPRLCGQCRGSGRQVGPFGDDVEDCHRCGGEGVLTRPAR